MLTVEVQEDFYLLKAKRYKKPCCRNVDPFKVGCCLACWIFVVGLVVMLVLNYKEFSE